MVKSLLHIPRKQARKACQAGTTPFRASKAPLIIAESSDNMTVKNNPVRIPMAAGSFIFGAPAKLKLNSFQKREMRRSSKKGRSSRSPTIYKAPIDIQVNKTPHDVREKQISIYTGRPRQPVPCLVLAECDGRE